MILLTLQKDTQIALNMVQCLGKMESKRTCKGFLCRWRLETKHFQSMCGGFPSRELVSLLIGKIYMQYSVAGAQIRNLVVFLHSLFSLN